MKGDRALMAVHVRTLFSTDADGRLGLVNTPDGGDAPRFFQGRTAEGNACWYRADLDGHLVDELAEACRADDAPWSTRGDGTPYVTILQSHGVIRSAWAGPAYRFPESLPPIDAVSIAADNARLLNPYMSEWQEDVAACQPFVAIVREGVAVSLCCSVRIGEAAHEAGVETHPEFRGRGYAVAAVTAWASAVRRVGAIPLYSTSWENEASMAVARRAGLVQYGSTFHLT